MAATVLDRLEVLLQADDKGLSTGLNRASNNISKFGKIASSTGRTLTRKLSVPLAGLGAALGATVVKTGRLADEILDLSQQTGLGTDAIQEFRRVTAAAGTAPDAVAKAASALTKQMSQGAEGSADMRIALAELGISLKDTEGNLRSTGTITQEAITALAGMEDVTARNVLATRLFRRSAEDLEPVLGLGTKRIAELREEAQRMGLVLSGDQLQAANKFREAWDATKQTLAAAGAQVGLALTPALEKILPIVQDKIVPAVGRFAEFLAGLDERVLIVAATIGGVAAAGGPLLSLVGTLAKVGSAVTRLAGFLTPPAGIFVAAAIAAFVIWQKWGDDIKRIAALVFEKVKVAFSRVAEIVGPVLETALQVGAAAWATARDFIIGAVQGLVKGVRTFLLAPLQAIWDKVKAGLERVKGFFSGLASAVVGNSIVPDMVDAITSEFDRLGTAMDLRTQLATRSVAQSFSALSVATGQIVPAMVNRAARDFRVLAGRMRRQAERIQVGVTKAFFQMATGVRFGMGKTGESAERGTRAVSSNFQDMKNSLVRSLSIAGNSVKRFVQSVLTQLGRIAGGAIGGAIGAAVGGAIGSFFGGLFQHGGTLPLGKFGVVGEAGPELVAATPRGAVIEPLRARAPSVTPAERAVRGGSGPLDVRVVNPLQLDMAGLPPPPRAVTPDAIAVDTFWREALSRLIADAKDRGVSF